MHYNQTAGNKIDKEEKQVTILPNHRLIEYKNATYYGGLNRNGKCEGAGLLIYDDGNFLISYFKQGSPSGKFFFFESMGTGMCFYGALENRFLQGVNFAISRKNAMVRAQFRSGKPRSSEFNVKNKYHTYLYRNNPEGKEIRQSSDYNSQQFILPTDFLNTHFQTNQHSELKEDSFRTFDIGENQIYFGVVQDGKPNGCGVIFINQWPVCYGMFQNGKLEGQARVEENPLMVIDGIFHKSEMKVGWIMNYKDSSLSFGQKNNDRKVFQLIEQSRSINLTKIQKFKKQIHLKSLFFQNSYAKDFIPRAMWPQQYLQQIAYEQVIKDIMNNFSPSHISEISGIADFSSNRVERDLVDLIKEHKQHVKSKEKISRILESRLQEYSSKKSRDNKEKKSKSREKSQKRLQKQNIGSSKRRFETFQSRQKLQQNKSTEQMLINNNSYSIGKTINSPFNPQRKKEGHKKSTLNLDHIYSKYLRKN